MDTATTLTLDLVQLALRDTSQTCLVPVATDICLGLNYLF